MAKQAGSNDTGVLTHAAAGGLSGMVAMAMTYPLATLSTKAQASGKSSKEEVEDEEKSLDELQRQIKKESTRKQFDDLVDKIGGMYGGLGSALVGIVATNFVYYYFYELTGKKLREVGSRRKRVAGTTAGTTAGLSARDSVIAGLVGGLVSRIVTNPIWVANTRLSVNGNVKGGKYQSTWSTLVKIVREEGWQALFSGLTPAMLLVLSPVVQFTVFEQLKTIVVTRKNKALTAMDALYLGALGKLVATLITYPYYTVRSRMHMPGNRAKGMLTIVKEIFTKEGIQSFYGGLGLKLLQGILNAGFLFYFKEAMVLRAQAMIRTLLKLVNTAKRVTN